MPKVLTPILVACFHLTLRAAGPLVFPIPQEMQTTGAAFPIDETVRSFREVLDGKHDELPESAFFMKGSIDQVVEGARRD